MGREDFPTQQVHLVTSDKVVELAERGSGLKDTADRQAIEHGMQMGHGGLFLNLTQEQHDRLK